MLKTTLNSIQLEQKIDLKSNADIRFLPNLTEVTGVNLIYNFSFLMLQSFHFFLSFPTCELRYNYKNDI